MSPLIGCSRHSGRQHHSVGALIPGLTRRSTGVTSRSSGTHPTHAFHAHVAIGFETIRRRAVRSDGVDRRLSESPRFVPSVAVAPTLLPANPFPTIGEFLMCDSSPGTI